MSQKINITHLRHRAKKVVAWLNPVELKSTWVGSKALVRTRGIIDNGGEILILAPGVRSFGENEEMDKLIRKYGYCGTERIIQLYQDGEFEGKSMGLLIC